MKNRSNTTQRPAITRYAISAVTFIILFLVVWQLYLLLVPHARISFTIYAPANKTIRNANETLYGTELPFGINNFVTPQVSVRYGLAAGDLYVYQTKAVDKSYDCALRFTGQTCTQHITPYNQRYIWATSVSSTQKDPSGKPYTTQSVLLKRDDTKIVISSNKSLDWNQAQWDTLINSLQPTKIPNLPVRWEKPGP